MLNLRYSPLEGESFKDGHIWINGDLSPTLLNQINASKDYPEGVDLCVSTSNVITAICVATKRGLLKPGEVNVIFSNKSVTIDKYGRLDTNSVEGLYLGINEMLMELF